MAAAKAAEAAGAFAVVLELVPADVAAAITAAVAIPTIGIGAGVGCDGQVLVVNDLLGFSPGRYPRHVKTYADLRTTILDAVTRFRDDVRQQVFPGDEQTFR
jgi:3-methyl-2-oxobutanoate hydroxymethyltransferase